MFRADKSALVAAVQQFIVLSPREFANGHWQIAGSGHASPEARI
jgi:hypothetical protein